MLDESFYDSARTHLQRATNNTEDLCKLIVGFTEAGRAHPELQPLVLRYTSLCENLVESLIDMNLDTVKLALNQVALTLALLKHGVPLSSLLDTPDGTSPEPGSTTASPLPPTEPESPDSQATGQ